ncbi:MAG: IS30 family transposase [Pseudomonadota bacterium]
MGTNYSHLSADDRTAIQALSLIKTQVKLIAEQLGFSRSTIYRELNRGKADETSLREGYRATRANDRARAKCHWAGFHRRKLGSDTSSPLWRTVIDGLRCHWSPEQIAGKLPRMNAVAAPALVPSPGALPSVSHETIYCALYAMPRTTLRSELLDLLRKGHKTRLPRARGTDRKGGIPNMTSIDMRPPEVAARIVPGHWEGDLIKGSTAEDILHGFKRRLQSIPESLRKTMTYDQGREMSKHLVLSAELNMDIYFCDPRSPWQRGSNENANGLIREYLPKGTDLSQISQQQLTAIEHSLNNRPRKSLNFHSPAEVFDQLTSDLIRGVALQL